MSNSIVLFSFGQFPGRKAQTSKIESVRFLIVWAAAIVCLAIGARPGSCDAAGKPDIPVRKMTLADAVLVSLTNNVTLRSAYLDRHLQRIDLQLAERQFFLPTDPKLMLSVNRSSLYMPSSGADTSSRTEDLLSTGDFSATLAIPTGGLLTFAWANKANRPDLGNNFGYSSDWSAIFTQPLLKGGGLTNAAYNVKIARITEENNILNLKETIASTIKQTITAFRSYKTAERQLVIAEMGLVRARALHDYNKDMIQAGRMAGTEIVQTQADIATQETSVIDAKNNLDNARLLLIQALYIDKNTVFETVDETQPFIPTPSREEALALAYQYRTDYLQALQNLEAKKLALARAKRNRLWSLNLTGLTSDSAASTISDSFNSAFKRSFGNAPERNWFAGLSLEIPLVHMTLDMRSYYGSKIEMDKAEMAFEKLKLDIEINVLNAVRNVDSSYRSLKSAVLARELAEKKLTIEQEKLSAGRTTNFQLVSFQRDFQTAQLSELTATTNYLNALTNLDDTLGTTLTTWKIDVSREDNQIRRQSGQKETPSSKQ